MNSKLYSILDNFEVKNHHYAKIDNRQHYLESAYLIKHYKLKHGIKGQRFIK